MNTTLVILVAVPLLPVTTVVNIPFAVLAALHVNVEVPLVPSVTVFGDKLQVKPIDGVVEFVKAIVPVKPPEDITVIVEVPDEPAVTGTVAGAAERAKSLGTV